MADNWIKLGQVRFPDKCLYCKKMIYRGETAWWLKSQGILHPECGTGPKPFSKRFNVQIYTENPAYDKDPFENIHEHTPTFYAAKEWRTSRD
mgnify:FL=1